MYSVLPIESSVVFVPVVATSTPAFRAKTPVPSNAFDGGLSTFVDESVDFIAARRPPSVVAASPTRSMNRRTGCLVVSPTSIPAERSTPLKPAKRDRAADDEDRRILRCKRSLVSSPKTAPTSRPDGGSHTSSSSSSFAASESVERRNSRERRRVKLINVTFATLRNRLPSYCWQHGRQQREQQARRDRRMQRGDGTGAAGRGVSKRPSKVDTLRTAINYIRCLQDLLADDDRQRLSTFQTFDDAATDTVVAARRWTASPSAVVGYDSCSPATSASSSSLDDLTTATATTAAMQVPTNASSSPDFSDEILSRDVDMSPIQDILDWLI